MCGLITSCRSNLDHVWIMCGPGEKRVSCNVQWEGDHSSITITPLPLSDWLCDSTLSGPHGVDLEAGHYTLGKECAAEILGHEDHTSVKAWDLYILKYTVRHLTQAGQKASPFLKQGQMIDCHGVIERSHGSIVRT